MKRLEIVLERDQLPAACAVLCDHATGYTVVPDVSGFGHHGPRDGDIVLVVTVVTIDHVDAILDALLPMLDKRSGVVVITDVQVLRGEYFVPEVSGKLGGTAQR